MFSTVSQLRNKDSLLILFLSVGNTRFHILNVIFYGIPFFRYIKQQFRMQVVEISADRKVRRSSSTLLVNESVDTGLL
jgi:hypothetical protein